MLERGAGGSKGCWFPVKRLTKCLFFKIMYICYFGKKSKKKIGGIRWTGKKQIKLPFSISEFIVFSGTKNNWALTAWMPVYIIIPILQIRQWDSHGWLATEKGFESRSSDSRAPSMPYPKTPSSALTLGRAKVVEVGAGVSRINQAVSHQTQQDCWFLSLLFHLALAGGYSFGFGIMSENVSVRNNPPRETA